MNVQNTSNLFLAAKSGSTLNYINTTQDSRTLLLPTHFSFLLCNRPQDNYKKGNLKNICLQKQNSRKGELKTRARPQPGGGGDLFKKEGLWRVTLHILHASLMQHRVYLGVRFEGRGSIPAPTEKTTIEKGK